MLHSTLAGIAGGLAASWIMDGFITQVGSPLSEKVMSRDKWQRALPREQERGRAEDTMNAADAVVNAATGGEHLSYEARSKGGHIVHYTFGALMGGLYGALSAYSDRTTTGFGTAFGLALFAAGDMAAVPALQLAPSRLDQPAAAQATPLAAHLVYGASTDLVRRAILAAA